MVIDGKLIDSYFDVQIIISVIFLSKNARCLLFLASQMLAFDAFFSHA